MTMDPSISLPLLLGLSRSTGSTQEDMTNKNTGPDAKDTKPLLFQQRLHHLLCQSDVVQWQPHGRAFKIVNESLLKDLLDCKEEPSALLEKDGFKSFKGGTDEGCWYKDGFTRGGIDEVPILPISDTKSKTTLRPKKKKKGEVDSLKVAQFLSVTASNDRILARRYLELSGQNVEMAVTLFLESGGGFGFSSAAASPSGDDEDEMNEEEEVQEEEPDFYALPFASAPPRQSPGSTQVVSALIDYWAFRTVRRALLRWIHARKNSITSIETGSSARNEQYVAKSLQSSCKHGTSHFLMQSLIHPSINVRRAAGRMFIHNLHRVQGMDKKNAVQGMQEALLILLHQVMFDEAPYEHQDHRQVSTSRSSVHRQANEGDPAVQLMGMLTSLVCDGGFSNILIGDHIKTFDGKGSGILLNAQLQEMASFSIESFVASGGLRWACGSIIRLVHMLVHGALNDVSSSDDGSGSDSDSNQRRQMGWSDGGVGNKTIQTRLVLLVDLVYRLVLFGSVPHAVDKQGGSSLGVADEDDTDGKPASKAASSEDAQKRKKRNHLAQFYEIMARREAGDTSRTTALRNSIRSSLASRGMLSSPPLPTAADKDKGIGDGGGEKERQTNPYLAEENRLRRERRKATLERVHSIFWSTAPTTLPAAICLGNIRVQEDTMGTVSIHETCYANFSPLACLIAAYEMLRSPSIRLDDATNKSIAILSRLVDPAAGCCLVVSDSEIPWGLANLLGEWKDDKGVDRGHGMDNQEGRSKKRARSVSQENQRLKSSPSRLNAGIASQNDSTNRAKRQRTRRNHISLLERLGDSSQDNPGSVGYSPASLAASPHYSSLLLRGAGGAGLSSAPSSANRDGSLSRIIAAAGERLGESSSAIRARAVLDRSPGDWRLVDSIAEHVDDRDVEESGVVMMDDDDDTEFEQEQEGGPSDDMEELLDRPDDDEGGGDEEGEDEDGDEGEENDTDEGEEENSIENSIFDDAVIVLDQVAAVGQDDRDHQKSNPHRRPSPKRVGELSLATKEEHEKAYLRSAMEILSAQYPGYSHCNRSRKSVVNAHSIFSQPPASFRSPLMTLSAEQSLMQSMADIVKPPKKPLNLKIFLRRAPTQEEFFRGALTRNPINLSSLKSSTEDSHEPTFADLRKHIAKDLQMEDSAELLELLVATKIIDINVKLRVAQQVLWKKYVMENSTSASSLISGAGPGHQMINTGSGLSMIFSSSGLSGRLRGSGPDAELDTSQLPPMVVTYRLAGVDGEATEDKVEVEDLEDPEAVVVSCPQALETKMEKEFGITRHVAENGGISMVLASVQSYIDEVTARIRRDEIRLKRRVQSTTDENQVRLNFVKSPPCPGLLLLRHCANLTENRKKMLAARAPFMLLRMLLDVLNAMNRSSNRRQRSLTFDGALDTMDVDEARGSKEDISSAESNPTTNTLQEIIELLASDISAEVSLQSNSKISKSGSFVDLTTQESNDDHSTLILVLKSLRSTNLSPNLRKIISKLLPFLTYGQLDQSEELASFFVRYIKLDLLAEDSEPNHDLDMMNTFVDTATNLPAVAVCDNLRQALLSNGFVDKVKSFIMLNAPLQPPPWSPALYPKQLSKKKPDDTKLKEEWKHYFERPGLAEATKILIGLCSKHHPTQTKLAEAGEALDLPSLCHWIESTSDNEASGIKMNGLGILAETLLDGLKESNADTSEMITAIRRKTRERKKEIAEERRNRALVGMSAFGTLAGSAVADARKTGSSSTANVDELRSTSVFASMFGLAAFSPSATQRKTRASAKDSEKTQPSWMAEMEAMEEEAFACAVCQEGRTLQPSELLGLYAFMKKVTIPSSYGGDKGDIDGTVMLLSLPVSCPRSIIGSEYESLFKRGKAAASAVSGTSQALSAMAAASSISGSSNSSSRTSYTTSVSAGNAIHCSCHSKAKAADRSHPKAPKSEWEGASLRNSRVTCNVILPLVSSKTSNVPLIAVENALGEFNAITTTILGARPKSMLWNVLHDVRLLMLRMSYGEALNADCGGGSSSSNFLLVLYQLYTADMLSNNAELDDPQVAKHARGLSLGFLAASGIVDAVDFTRADTRSKRLERGLANAAPMAALCSILFYNSTDCGSSGASFAHNITDSEHKAPSPNRQWELHKDKFLAGLLRCAGHRNSVGATDSGCATSRGISTGSRKNVERARSFIDWSAEESSTGAASKKKAKGRSILEDYAVPLRPMITLYAMLNALSKEFVINDTDENTLGASERLASTLESCLKATCITDLLNAAEITMDHEAICKHFEKGLII